MVEISPLQRYRNYLDALEEFAPELSEDEYLEFLGAGEVVDLLCARDEVEVSSLTADDRREIERLDDLLVKHRRAMVAATDPFPTEPKSRWWWHLHEGPQVRDQARHPRQSAA